MLALSPRTFLPSVLLAIILFAFVRSENGSTDTVAEPASIAISDKHMSSAIIPPVTASFPRCRPVDFSPISMQPNYG